MFSPEAITWGVIALVIGGCVAVRVCRPKLHATYTPYADRAGYPVPPTFLTTGPRQPLPDDPALTYTGDPDLQVVDFDEPAPSRRGGRARYVVAVIVVLWYAAVLIGHAHIAAPWWVPVTVAAWNGIAIAARRRRAAA